MGLCCGATGECHLTNEFLLTSLSPLKNLFVLLQQHAALPCSCLCSQTQVLVLYIPVLFVLWLPASHALSSETLSCHIAFLMCFCSCVLLIIFLVFALEVVEFVKNLLSQCEDIIAFLQRVVLFPSHSYRFMILV